MAFVGCASTPVSSTKEHSLDQSGTGWIEFYCASCVTEWSVYEIAHGREKRILNLTISGNADLLHNPVRMRRVGIAYPPGEFEFLIRLQESMLRSGHVSERIRVTVTQGVIIPVRVDARKQTHITMVWETVVGPPLPVSNDSASMERLLGALSDPDWGTRWYAAEAIGHIEGDVGEELRAGLKTLESDPEYNRCLGTAATIQCSLVSEQAKRILGTLRAENNPPHPDHESPTLGDPRQGHPDNDTN
jgi:hypothetical protein